MSERSRQEYSGFDKDIGSQSDAAKLFEEALELSGKLQEETDVQKRQALQQELAEILKQKQNLEKNSSVFESSQFERPELDAALAAIEHAGPLDAAKLGQLLSNPQMKTLLRTGSCGKDLQNLLAENLCSRPSARKKLLEKSRDYGLNTLAERIAGDEKFWLRSRARKTALYLAGALLILFLFIALLALLG